MTIDIDLTPAERRHLRDVDHDLWLAVWTILDSEGPLVPSGTAASVANAAVNALRAAFDNQYLVD